MPTAKIPTRARARSAARLAAVQALYQRDMEGTPVPLLLHEFHHHRLGATIEDVEYADAEVEFFDDLVKGVAARAEEIDVLLSQHIAKGWRSSALTKQCPPSFAPAAINCLLGPTCRGARELADIWT